MLESMIDLYIVKRDYDAARVKFIESGGYDWGWAGYHHQEALDKALESFGLKLDEYVDTRVKKALDSANKTSG